MGIDCILYVFDKNVYKYHIIYSGEEIQYVVVERKDGEQFVRKRDPKSEYLLKLYDGEEVFEEDKYRRIYEVYDTIEVHEMSNIKYKNYDFDFYPGKYSETKEYGNVKNNDVFIVVWYW